MIFPSQMSVTRTCILILILADCCVFFMIHVQRVTMTTCQFYQNSGNIDTLHIGSPTLHLLNNETTTAVRNICQRWGYVEVYTQTAATKAQLTEHPQRDVSWYFDNIEYRIFQNTSTDKCTLTTHLRFDERIFAFEYEDYEQALSVCAGKKPTPNLGQIEIYDYIPVLNRLVTFKANLVTGGGKYIPKGFFLPYHKKDFLRYLRSPHYKGGHWIKKDPAHRANIILPINEINLFVPSIVQEYIGDPFIIDKRKFTIAVYVAFSSAKPLRVYVDDAMVLLRFAEKEYYPENVNDPKTYVTDGQEIYNIRSALQVEPLKTYKEKYQYTIKKAFYTYIRSVGEDPIKIFQQMYDAIREVVNKRADEIEENSAPEFKYIEFTRWDFIVDSNLSVNLIEANFNPSLYTSRYRKRVDFEYCDHVAYNSFRVMGLEQPFKWKRSSSFYIRNADVNIIDKACYSAQCSTCERKECYLCSHCLSKHQLWPLKQMLQEHIQRGTTRLIYPFVEADLSHDEAASKQRDNGEGINNRVLHATWLRAKCQQDHNWCFE